MVKSYPFDPTNRISWLTIAIGLFVIEVFVYFMFVKELGQLAKMKHVLFFGVVLVNGVLATAIDWVLFLVIEAIRGSSPASGADDSQSDD